MKTIILMSLLITSNAFAMSYEDCVKTVGHGAYENEAGEVFIAKMERAYMTRNQLEIAASNEVYDGINAAVAKFCTYTTKK